MMKILIDTWGWVCLYNKREKRHEEVKNWYHEFRSQRGVVYTTDYILDETFTLLFRRTPFEVAAEAEIQKFFACVALFEHYGYRAHNFLSRSGRPAKKWEHGIIVKKSYDELVVLC